MDAWLCKSCGHEDNDRDPKTRELIGPIHATIAIVEAFMRVESVPKDLTAPMGMVEFCLVCNTICKGEYTYEIMP